MLPMTEYFRCVFSILGNESGSFYRFYRCVKEIDLRVPFGFSDCQGIKTITTGTLRESRDSTRRGKDMLPVRPRNLFYFYRSRFAQAGSVAARFLSNVTKITNETGPQ
jgi:hypothetical protein